MAPTVSMVRQTLVVLMLAVISRTSSHRLSGHPYLKSKNVTVGSATTQQSTQSVVIDDKQQGPSIKYPPPPSQSFIDYLVHRDTYFDKVGSVSNHSTSPPTEATSRRAPDPTTTLRASETTTAKSTSTESTRTTAITSTATTLNPNLMPFSSDSQAQIKDRLSRFQLADIWLRVFRRPSILDPVQSRFRSNNADPRNTTEGKTNALSASPSPSNTKPNQGIVEIGPNGGVYIVNNKQTQSKAATVAVADKIGPTLPPAPTTVDVQDKPFYGSSLGQYFDNDRQAENTANDSQKNQTAEKQHGRRRRAADGTKGNDTACADPLQFKPCQYYSQCFATLADTCSSRDSFLGNAFSRFCSRTVETSRSAKSQLLSSYLTQVELCLRQELVNIVEYPSCADVTRMVQESLHLKRPGSCLYRRQTFCQVLEDEVARPSLAKMFNTTSDVQFMFRVMVNIGSLASYCRGQGASIFVTDIALLATANDSPYKHLVGNTPIPGIVPKY